MVLLSLLCLLLLLFPCRSIWLSPVSFTRYASVSSPLVSSCLLLSLSFTVSLPVSLLLSLYFTVSLFLSLSFRLILLLSLTFYLFLLLSLSFTVSFFLSLSFCSWCLHLSPFASSSCVPPSFSLKTFLLPNIQKPISFSLSSSVVFFQTADYGLSHFSALQSLLLAHGRWNYRRVSRLVLYMFYKNIVLVLPMFFYGYLSLFSSQKFYFEFLYQMYNVVFTAVRV